MEHVRNNQCGEARSRAPAQWDKDIALQEMRRVFNEQGILNKKDYVIANYQSTAKKNMERTLMFLKEHFDDIDGFQRQLNILFIIFNLIKAYMTYEQAAIMVIKVNDKFINPVDMESVLIMFDVCNESNSINKKICPKGSVFTFTNEKICEFLELNLEESERYGFLDKKIKKENAQKHKEKSEAMDKRATKLFLEGNSVEQVLELLHNEGFNVCLRTLKGHLKKLNVTYKSRDEGLKLEHVDFEKGKLYASYDR